MRYKTPNKGAHWKYKKGGSTYPDVDKFSNIRFDGLSPESGKGTFSNNLLMPNQFAFLQVTGLVSKRNSWTASVDEKGTKKKTPVPLAKGLHKRHQLSNLIYLEMNYNQFNFTFHNSSDQHFIRTFAKAVKNGQNSAISKRLLISIRFVGPLSTVGRLLADNSSTVDQQSKKSLLLKTSFR